MLCSDMASVYSSPGLLRYRRAIAVWLFLCCGMVALMVAVGGYTRLTQSGLSMVEWKPVTGVIPPLTETAWQEEFDKYRTSPEYQKVNYGMSLEAFKEIYWVEFIHRVLGRMMGLLFFLPYVFFLWRKAVPRVLGWQLFGVFLLGGLQGFIGWYMVQSGLVDRPDVSHYRLTLHLGMAFVIYALLFSLALRVLWAGKEREEGALRFKQGVMVFIGVVFVQVLLGGMVAGVNGGLVYNTFPTMNGYWVPPELFSTQYLWGDPAVLQFFHRMLAYVVVVMAALLWWGMRKNTTHRRAVFSVNLLMVIVCLQVILGVLTVLHHVPVGLGVLHQAGALALFSVSLYIYQKHYS